MKGPAAKQKRKYPAGHNDQKYEELLSQLHKLAISRCSMHLPLLTSSQ